MELIRGIHNLRERHRGCVATIGNYDGVHRGHQHMIAAVRAKARALGVPAVVVTFEPTPREFFEGPAAPSRLTRLREKLEALAEYGVDRVVVLRFDRRMQGLSADEFVERLLVNGLGVRHMVVGHDFHFARRREGTIETLRAAGAAHGFTVEEVGRFLLAVAGGTERWIEMGAWTRVQWMTLLVVGGGGLYFGTLYVLGMRLKELRVRPVAMPRAPDSANV